MTLIANLDNVEKFMATNFCEFIWVCFADPQDGGSFAMRLHQT